ncbi:MAG: hypothetical protein GY694_16430 [Gammaproteobacteria bacterium]|nr:hypothetical protein [Gammaproteobacteria bacterium]
MQETEVVREHTRNHQKVKSKCRPVGKNKEKGLNVMERSKDSNTVNQWPADRHDGSLTTEEEGEDENVVILISRMLNS